MVNWLHKIRRTGFTITPHTKVCSRHFTKDQIRTTAKGRRFLTANAIPTLFEWNAYSNKTRAGVWERRTRPTSSPEPGPAETEEEIVDMVPMPIDHDYVVYGFMIYVPIEHRVKATDYLSIVADHVHPFMTTVYPSSDGYFQQDNAPCHKARIISDWFLEHDNEFTVLKWPPQSPDLNPIEHLWDVVEREIRIMDVQPTNLQQLRDAIMSISTKLSEECFQYLVESVPRRIKAVLKAKGGPTRY
ncbi:Transposable element Tcb1 transposase [Merluccius polli]|uniref:Transposable element Tcb1 transposase n=1 Tax=Merluccius polli TaxID=89951 RepID=A0AA47M5Z1_MERPO|nr:Transposable element Tcb1 transposase [Merluccius polli]